VETLVSRLNRPSGVYPGLSIAEIPASRERADVDTLSPEDVRLHVVAHALRRRYLLIAVVTLAIAGLAFAGASKLKPSYTATATVLVQPVPGTPLAPGTSNSTGAQLTVAMQTEAGLVNIPAVAALASTSAGSTLPATADHVGATVPSGTQIIAINYLAPTALRAREGANAFANAYLAYRGNVAETAKKANLASLSDQAKATDAALKKATIAAEADTNPRSYAAQQVQLYAARLATLNDNISTQEAVSTVPGSVLTAAALPTAPAGLSKTIVLAAGIIFGLIFGLLLAIWREWRDDRIHAGSEDEVRTAPVLTRLPQGAQRPVLISQGDGWDELYESYRRLRLAIVASGPTPRVVAVSSISGHLPSAVVTANLGVALQSAGFRTTVVAADLETPILEELLDVPVSPGLAEIFLAGSDVTEGVISPSGLRVIPRGANAGAARELYAGSRFEFLVAGLRDEADYVLISSPPASTADGDAVAAAADGVVLLVADQRTTHAEVSTVLHRYGRLGVKVLGVVAVPRPTRHALAPAGSRLRLTKRSAPEVAPLPGARLAAITRSPSAALPITAADEPLPGLDAELDPDLDADLDTDLDADLAEDADGTVSEKSRQSVLIPDADVDE
jgi:Mrp family chromosome partitioning ATPase/capsular polysaccharide biosynthesis protein